MVFSATFSNDLVTTPLYLKASHVYFNKYQGNAHFNIFKLISQGLKFAGSLCVKVLRFGGRVFNHFLPKLDNLCVQPEQRIEIFLCFLR